MLSLGRLGSPNGCLIIAPLRDRLPSWTSSPRTRITGAEWVTHVTTTHAGARASVSDARHPAPVTSLDGRMIEPHCRPRVQDVGVVFALTFGYSCHLGGTMVLNDYKLR